ncbi:hypothetical protein [Aliiroseovarius crassostreae]|uniref:hypothetical protein n=1 Tax=Aliiroseovarius crassostreae TaxID=154981 RepID=UPI003C7AA2CE
MPPTPHIHPGAGVRAQVSDVCALQEIKGFGKGVRIWQWFVADFAVDFFIDAGDFGRA